MSGTVVDTSALLAWFLGERGGEVVGQYRRECGPLYLSVVNMAEFSIICARKGLRPTEARRFVRGLSIRIEPFLEDDAFEVGRLHPHCAKAGLSLGDKACLSLGVRMGCSILTADRDWVDKLDLSEYRRFYWGGRDDKVHIVAIR